MAGHGKQRWPVRDSGTKGRLLRFLQGHAETQFWIVAVIHGSFSVRSAMILSRVLYGKLFRMAVPSGVPRPVHASHPGPAT
jgi:hypothetical protein